VIGQDLVGDHVARHEAADDARADDGERTCAPRASPMGDQRDGMKWSRAAELPVSTISSGAGS
jgi:hypothetical protein